MSILTRMLSTVTANRGAQRGLESTVKICLQLMGVGTGAGAWSSGERSMIRTILKSAPSIPCLFDVGANKGQFLTLLLAELRTRDARIHVFEPGETAFRALSTTVDGEPRVTLNRVALGAAEGTAILHANEPGSGMASLTKRRLEHRSISFSHEEPVQVQTLDAYCRRQKIATIDLLKLDVEGHELQVLEGAREMLERRAIHAVAFEFGGCNIDTRTYFQDFYLLFRDLGMQIFRISPSGYACPVNQYRELYEQFRTTNFFARRVA